MQSLTALMEGSGASNSEDEDQFANRMIPRAKRPSDASQSGEDSMISTAIPTMNIASPKGMDLQEVGYCGMELYRLV